MHIVQIYVTVKPEFVEAFKQATIENAKNSVREPGIARFDLLQQADDPTRFVLLEVYRSPDAQGLHRETAHYAAWKNTCEKMQAEPRTRQFYTNVFPADEGW